MNGDSVPGPGVFSQQRAISVDPLPRVRAPGSDNSVTSFNTSPAETEDTNNQSHGHPAPQQDPSHQTITVREKAQLEQPMQLQ